MADDADAAVTPLVFSDQSPFNSTDGQFTPEEFEEYVIGVVDRIITGASDKGYNLSIQWQVMCAVNRKGKQPFIHTTGNGLAPFIINASRKTRLEP